MINQDNDDALRVYDLIGSYLDDEQHHSDSLNSGLIFLQKESNLSIATQNIPYLVILCVAYSNISDTTIQEELRKQLDQQFQALVQRLVNVLIQERLQIQKSFQNGIFSQNKDSKLLNEFLQISDNDLRSVTIMIQSLFFFFHSNLTYVLIIDKITSKQSSQNQDDKFGFDYVATFFYYFKMIIQVLFDHDAKVQEFNLKNVQDPSLLAKPIVEKNMRFSFRNKEAMESFLNDSVRSKLDFYKQLEDMFVPLLFNRNISHVMIMSNRLLMMIDGIIESVTPQKQMAASEAQLQLQAFKGQMRRFIVTNYEIYIDFLKGHSEFVAQRYFSKNFSISSRTSSAEEKILGGSDEVAGITRASIIGKIGVPQASDEQILTDIMGFVKAYSQLAQMVVEKIPIEEGKKQDQAQFRQDILAGVNKIMRKVFEKLQQVVQVCFSNSHKDSFFPSHLYQVEKEQYFFKGFIKMMDVKRDQLGGASQASIEQQDFLLRPRVAIQTELLTNSMTTLTLLLQIYQQINSIALQEFNACYSYIASLSLWEQMLSENCKKEFSRYIESLQNLSQDIMVFVRCELVGRAFSQLRELAKTDFQGVTTSSQRVEPFALQLIRDIKILHNFFGQTLGKVDMFYLFGHLQKFVYRLYGDYLRLIRRQSVDEYGFQRIKQSLFQIKLDFEMHIIPKLISESASSTNNKLIMRLRDELKAEITHEYERTLFIMQFLQLDELEIQGRIRDNEYGLTQEDFQIMLSTHSNHFAQ
ncbi:hypothetical protein FGO68_gene2070 [Halteria grandinella]|uniref:Uncharacterized protein n=1 Tax=Halteria grandinella TaxID=5974 RepID=A0A8J8P1V1_HALGN|nr:hypothetical protein FGO68_gene2070 [Halteria grandinella]